MLYMWASMKFLPNFAKSCILSCLSKFYNKKKKFTVPFLKYKRLKLKLRVFLAVRSVAIVTYCVTKITPKLFWATLRWLKTVSSTFQDLGFDRSL